MVSVQVVACLFYTYYVFARFLVPVFRNVGREPLSLRYCVSFDVLCILVDGIDICP